MTTVITIHTSVNIITLDHKSLNNIKWGQANQHSTLYGCTDTGTDMIRTALRHCMCRNVTYCYIFLILTPWRQNLEVHHRIHNSPPKVPSLRQVKPFHTLPAYLPKIHPNPILPSTPRSSEWSLSFGLSHQNPAQFSPLSHACHMPRPPHFPRFDLPNDMWWRVQIMKLPIVQLSPLFPSSFLGPNILLSTLFSSTLSLRSSLNVRDKVSHPYKTTGRIMVLYTLTFTFLDSRRED
jgi:hypothetical protein